MSSTMHKDNMAAQGRSSMKEPPKSMGGPISNMSHSVGGPRSSVGQLSTGRGPKPLMSEPIPPPNMGGPKALLGGPPTSVSSQETRSIQGGATSWSQETSWSHKTDDQQGTTSLML